MTSRLGIAHVTEAFAGGVATYMTLVLPALVGRGHVVTLYCCDGRGEARFSEAVRAMVASGVRVRLLPMRRQLRPWADARALVRLLREIRAERYDVIHTHGTKAGVLGRLAGRAAGRPVVHTPHCYAFLRARTRLAVPLLRATERALRRSTSGLIAVSASERRQAVHHRLVRLDRCVVVPNGLPLLDVAPLHRGRVRSRFGLPTSSFVVTMAARLVRYKGIDLLLKAAVRCRSMEATFVLAGHGEQARVVQQRVAALGLSDRVRLVGSVPDVPQLLQASDLCVLSSEAEGQPYVLLEAMRGGCAIVATAVPGIRDLLEHGRTALLVRRDAGELARAIARLRADASLRAHLAMQARQSFLSGHLLDRQVDALVDAYQRFRAMPPRRATAWR